MKKQIHDELIFLAEVGSLATYSDIGDLIGLSMAEKHEREQLANLLTEIANEENNLNRPMLTALVIKSGPQEIASDGFFQLAHQFYRFNGSTKEDDRKKFWEQERENVYQYWQNA
jgi:hypothetical protein